MTITTKFNAGEHVFTLDARTLKIKEFEISRISAVVTEGETHIRYAPEDKGLFLSSDSYDESKCFATKEELMSHISE